ncbi:MAG: hypothetical protein IH587_08385 [Anaerolineae bacterium]|nr:hypothetical protein [Anaerolineae bacterium]
MSTQPSAYMVELDIVKLMASGEGGLSGVTWKMVDQGNAEHAQANTNATKEDTL